MSAPVWQGMVADGWEGKQQLAGLSGSVGQQIVRNMIQSGRHGRVDTHEVIGGAESVGS